MSSRKGSTVIVVWPTPPEWTRGHGRIARAPSISPRHEAHQPKVHDPKQPKFPTGHSPILHTSGPNLGFRQSNLGLLLVNLHQFNGDPTMNYFKVVAAPFVRAGISSEASLAAAIASTAKELVEHRVRLKAPTFFEPDLTCSLCVIHASQLGGSRLLAAIEAHYRTNPPFMPPAIRNVGSLVLWELESLLGAANTRRTRNQANELCQTTFDSTEPSKSECALVVAHPEVLEASRPLLSKLLARAVVVCADQSSEGTVLRDFESASRAVAALRRFVRESPEFHFSTDAMDILEELPFEDTPDQRHHRVKIAKLSGLFFAGRQALEGGCAQIGAHDVAAARDMVLAGEGCGCEPLSPYDAETQEQEETFFERMMRTFGAAEVPMSIVQTKVRRSRKTGSIPVPLLLEGLAKRGRIQILECRPIGTRAGGRLGRIVVLPPAKLALTYPPRLALPAPSHQGNPLLPAA